MASLLAFLPLFSHFGLAPALVAQTVPFLKALVWSTLPLALYFALRRYLQAMHIVKPVVFALISANLVNLLGNWALVYGHLGAHGYGVAGSGWSTCISRTYMVAVLAIAAGLLRSQTLQRIVERFTPAGIGAHSPVAPTGPAGRGCNCCWKSAPLLPQPFLSANSAPCSLPDTRLP